MTKKSYRLSVQDEQKGLKGRRGRRKAELNVKAKRTFFIDLDMFDYRKENETPKENQTTVVRCNTLRNGRARANLKRIFEFTDRDLTCQVCGFTTRNKIAISSHYYEIHMRKIWTLIEDQRKQFAIKCPECPQRFVSDFRLFHHYNFDHHDGIYVELKTELPSSSNSSYSSDSGFNSPCSITGDNAAAISERESDEETIVVATQSDNFDETESEDEMSYLDYGDLIFCCEYCMSKFPNRDSFVSHWKKCSKTVILNKTLP